MMWTKWCHFFHLLYNDVNYDSYCGFYLVGGFSPSQIYKWASVGMMKFPTEWKVMIHSCYVSHQPVVFPYYERYGIVNDSLKKKR